MRWIWVLGLGAALGLAASMADFVGYAGFGNLWEVPAVLLNLGATWAGLAILAGYLLRTPLPGMVAGAMALTVGVTAYYLFGSLLGDRVGVDLGNLLAALRYWVLAGAVAGPVLGLVGVLSRRPDTLGFIAALAVPVGALAELFVAQRVGPDVYGVDPYYGAGVTLMLLAAVAGLAAVVRTKLLSGRPAVDAPSRAAAGAR